MEPEQKTVSMMGASALRYAEEFGYAVFPLESVKFLEGGIPSCTCARGTDCDQMGKHPLGALGPILCPDGETRKGLYHATTDLEKIRQWWTDYPYANIGIRTGSKKGGGSGIVVFDLDIGPGKDGWMDFWALEMDTAPLRDDGPQAETGSGGRHIVVQYPEESGLRIGNKRGLRIPGKGKKDKYNGIDIRGENGYIVAAPSLHKSGKRYGWLYGNHPLQDHAVAPEIPDALLHAIAFDGGGAPIRSERPEWEDEKKLKTMEKKARAALDKMPASMSGHDGHKALWNAVLVLHRGFCLPEDIVYNMIMEHFNPRCVPPWSSFDVNHKIEQAQINCEKEWGFRLKEEAEKASKKTQVTADSILDGTAAGEMAAAAARQLHESLGTILDTSVNRIPDWNINLKHGSTAEIARAMVAYFEKNGQKLSFDEGEFVQYQPSTGVWRILTVEHIMWMISRLDETVMYNGNKGQMLYIKGNLPQTVLSLITNQVKATSTWDFSKAPPGIAFKNGFVTVEDGEIKIGPHAPENYAKFAHDFEFDENAPCPDFDMFLDQILGNKSDAERLETKSFLQEFAGSCLMGLAPQFQQCLVLYGKGGNGKSQFLDALRSIFPPNTTCSLPPQKWGEPFRLAGLAGKLANFVDELPKTGITQGESFKSVVDGSEQDCNVKFRQPFIMRPKAGHIFACNDLPLSDDHSNGFWRRPLVVVMDRNMMKSSVVRSIGKQLGAREKSGIIAWAIRGAASVQARGGYAVPQASSQALNEWRIESDPVIRFLHEPDVRAKLSEGKGLQCIDLLARYKEWAAVRGHKEMNIITFGRRLHGSSLLGHNRNSKGISYFFTEEALKQLEAEDERLTEMETADRARMSKVVDERIVSSPAPESPEDDLPGWLDDPDPSPPPGPPVETQPLSPTPSEEAAEEMPEYMREEAPDSIYEGAEIVSYVDFMARRAERDRQDELGLLQLPERGR